MLCSVLHQFILKSIPTMNLKWWYLKWWWGDSIPMQLKFHWQQWTGNVDIIVQYLLSKTWEASLVKKSNLSSPIGWLHTYVFFIVYILIFSLLYRYLYFFLESEGRVSIYIQANNAICFIFNHIFTITLYLLFLNLHVICFAFLKCSIL